MRAASSRWSSTSRYFYAGQFGKAAAVAVVMLIILIPVMIFNIRRFRSGSVV